MSCGLDPTALRVARERVGLTQHQLALIVGVAGGERISRWELGLDDPRPASITRLARVLAVPTVGLLKLDPEGINLRALRYCAGLSASEVATTAHISVRSYARWEAGSWVRLPSAGNLRELARVLNVPVSTVRHALECIPGAFQNHGSRPDA